MTQVSKFDARRNRAVRKMGVVYNDGTSLLGNVPEVIAGAMLTQFFPFQIEINPVAIATSTLWASALYVGLSPVSQWISEQISRWFGYAERSLYLSAEEYERTRENREAQNDFWASIFSIVPFLLVGILCNYACIKGFGNQSWSLSLGIIALMGCGVYDLGRRDGQLRK